MIVRETSEHIPYESRLHKKHDPNSRLVMIIIPAQHLLSGDGAACVFGQEVKHIQRLGYRAALVVIAPTLKFSSSARKNWLRLIKIAASQLEADEVAIVSRIRPLQTFATLPFLLRARLQKRWSLDTDMALSKMMDVNRLKRLVPNEPVAVLCNYLSGLSVAEAIAIPSKQIIVLHDVVAKNISDKVVKELYLRPNLVTLSSEDTAKLRSKLPAEHCHTGIPIGERKPMGFTDLLPYRNLADVIRSSGPTVHPNERTHCTNWRTSSSLDLLFVGGAHPPNVAGLMRFVEDCYRPHLQHLDINFVVAGDVGTVLWKNNKIPKGITSLGRVKDLRPLYAAARLVIVPLISGAGVSIKTIEALTLGKTTLSSPVGLRGFSVPKDCTLAPPFDKLWAKRIIQLLQSCRERRALRDRSRMHISGMTLDDILTQILNRIQGCPKRYEEGKSITEPASEKLALVEWIGDLTGVPELLTNTQNSPEDIRKQLGELLLSRDVVSFEESDDVVEDVLRSAPL